ncbi:MAG: TRAP-type C4-dicarboxylate transport system, periplasmic component [Myxococcales bacterium]|nr:TRAP-type C4-dicarboxylate transport system, periplasmic component [Myxococcales bacterium]
MAATASTAALLLLVACATARAEPVTLRIGTVAPDGTGWAREFRAFARYAEAEAKGALKIKLYMSSVAGDELEMGERVRRGQLDGVASGQFLCQEVAPSMRLLRLPGVFESRDEARDVMTRLQPTLEDEAAQHGVIMLGSAGLGPDVLFTREPVRSMEDVKRLKLWRWDIDEVGIETSRAMGMQVVPTPLYDARRAYDDKKLDGFVAAPTAALAFQWSSAAGYVTDLHTGYLYGCLVFGAKQFQRLPAELQAALRAGAARMLIGIEELGRRQDAELLGGLFAKQGLRNVPVSEGFRAEFFTAAKMARDRIGNTLVPRALLERALRMLADYRIEHPRR